MINFIYGHAFSVNTRFVLGKEIYSNMTVKFQFKNQCISKFNIYIYIHSNAVASQLEDTDQRISQNTLC